MVRCFSHCQSPQKNCGTARSLSPNLRQLLNCMWQLGFGTLRGVHFRDGDPLLDPSFRIVRKARLSEPPWMRPESATADYALKREHQRLMEELRAAGAGVVDIKVVQGLPTDLEIEQH